MERLHFPHAKLLYAVSMLSQDGMITPEQTFRLKGEFGLETLDRIISQDPEMSQLLDDEPDEATLKARLQTVVQNEQKGQPTIKGCIGSM